MSHQRTANKSRRSADGNGKNSSQSCQSQCETAKEPTAGSAKEKTHQLKEETQEVWEKGKQQLHEQTERAKAKGESFANEKKDRMASEVSHFGSAIHEAASRLHEEDDQTLAQYADMAAERMDRFSRYLRERDADRLLHDTENLARSQPEIVYGALFVAGLGIARFLKASGSRRSRQTRSAPTSSRRNPTRSANAGSHNPQSQS